MIYSTKQNVGASTLMSSSVHIQDEINPISSVSISSLGSLISENKFVPLDQVEDLQNIFDFSFEVYRLFHNASSTEKVREESLQLIALEKNTDLRLPIEEATESKRTSSLYTKSFSIEQRSGSGSSRIRFMHSRCD